MKNQQYSISRRGLYTGLFLLILLMSTGISGCSDETTTTSSTPESSGMEPDSQESSSDSVQEVDATGIAGRGRVVARLLVCVGEG